MYLYALKKKYEAEVAEHTSIIDTYLKNPVGIGDHDNILDIVKKRFDKLTLSKLALKDINEIIDKAENLDWFESIYNKEFYTKYAADGKTHIENRYQSIYTFSSDKYGVIH